MRQASTDPSSQVDAMLSRWVQASTPGAAVIVLRHGRVLLEKGYGLADVTTRVPITSRTVFDIASVSKPITAMAVLMLVEHGKLHYTDSLGAFFPEFAAEAREITVRQLLSHTSGLPDYTLAWGDTRRLKDTPRTADAVSRVAQELFPEYVRTRIFKPLGMNDSFVYERGAAVAGTTGYTVRGSRVVPAARNTENYVYGDGQVNSTVDDLAKWSNALYDLILKIRNDEGTLWLVPSGQNRVKLVPVSDDEFLLDGSNGASSLVFHRNAGGSVTCLSLLDQNGTTFWKSAAAR